jgi:hypothetical protein
VEQQVIRQHIQLRADKHVRNLLSVEKNANCNSIDILKKYLEIQLLIIDIKMTTTYNVHVFVTTILFNYPKIKQ